MYFVEDVICICGLVCEEVMFVYCGVENLWNFLYIEDYICVFGVYIGGQVVQQVWVGFKVIYFFGWQVVVDGNFVGQIYFDQLFYLVNLVLVVVCCINNVFICQDQLEYVEGEIMQDWFVLIVVDVEVGFGGLLNVYEFVQLFIQVGVVVIYWEDQFVSEKKCGYFGGKVFVFIQQYICMLNVVCFVVDVVGVLIVIIVCIDVFVVDLFMSDVDECDWEFIIGECILEGFYWICLGIEFVISCGFVFVFYVDLFWVEIGELDIELV